MKKVVIVILCYDHAFKVQERSEDRHMVILLSVIMKYCSLLVTIFIPTF